MAGCAQNHTVGTKCPTVDTKGYTIDTKGRGKILRFHFLIETDIFKQIRRKKCAADNEKSLSLGSTFGRGARTYSWTQEGVKYICTQKSKKSVH